MYLCVWYMHVCTHVCRCSCPSSMCGSQSLRLYSLHSLLPYCLKQGLSQNLMITVFQLTRKCLKNSCPPLTQVLWSRAHPSISSFDRAVDWSSGPHVCPASTLPTEPSPQPQKFILKLEVSKDLKRHGFVHKRC